METLRHWNDTLVNAVPPLPSPSLSIGGLSTLFDTCKSALTDAYTSLTSSTLHDVVVHYLPLFTVIVLFWPVVVTFLVAFFSGTTWLFWLVTSVIFGVIQLIFASQQFLMIMLDIFGLSALKTFAMVRSQVRYYTVMSGLSKVKKGRKLGRRREWRRKLNEAHSLRDYRKIEIEEPPLMDGTDGGGGLGSSSRAAALGETPSMSMRNLLSIGRRSISERKKDGSGMVSRTPPRPPKHPSSYSTAPSGGKKKKKRNNSSSNTSSSSSTTAIRKSKSCANLIENPNGYSLTRPKSSENMQTQRAHSMSTTAGTTSGSDVDIVEAQLGMTGEMLRTTTARLREARIQATSSCTTSGKGRQHTLDENNETLLDTEEDSSASSLKFLLTGVVKRNHLCVDDIMIDNARCIAERGQHSLSRDSRDVILGYNEEVERCLDWIADSPVSDSNHHPAASTSGPSRLLRSSSSNGSTSMVSDMEECIQRQSTELSDRILLVRKMKQNMGRTALMLSGGGAQAMYHLGTIRALIESKVYHDIRVVSGTSGGSIAAAMCAIKTPDEMLRDICVKTVSTDYLLNGEMKRKNIRWFPRLVDMGAYWLKNKLMVDSAEFKRCCDFYWSDTTFEEAFERTGKHVCITVSASRATGSGGNTAGQRLLLNHISTPHVTLSSAVAASCALPGVMAPTKLVTKDSTGKLEPFEVDGVEWIDGSVQADLPFRRISTLFNVSNYIVCQTNFHVIPFLNKAHHPNPNSLYWRLFQICEWDIRNRALNLSRLGLFPKMFGQDVSNVFKQKYHGNLTLVPRFTTMQTFGLKALVNPTVKDMEVYLQNGQEAGWPYVDVIHEMLRLERSIDRCLSRLEERIRSLSPSDQTHGLSNDNDDVESISSSNNMTSLSNLSVASRVFLRSAGREAELLRQKVQTLEVENDDLRKQVMQLQRALGLNSGNNNSGDGGSFQEKARGLHKAAIVSQQQQRQKRRPLEDSSSKEEKKDGRETIMSQDIVGGGSGAASNDDGEKDAPWTEVRRRRSGTAGR